jgi:hypothetical protein
MFEEDGGEVRKVVEEDVGGVRVGIVVGGGSRS